MKVSSSFYAVANGSKVGDNIKNKIDGATGRDGAPIAKSTIFAWANRGLVKVKRGKPGDGDHWNAKPITEVRLTRVGYGLVKERNTRVNNNATKVKRSRKAA